MFKGPKYQRGIVGIAAAGTMAGAKTLATGAGEAVVAWPNVDTWSLDTYPVEYTVTGAGQVPVGCVWNNDGTRLYVVADSGTISPTWHNSPDYSTPYVPVDDTSPTNVFDPTGNERSREFAWNGDGTSLIVAQYQTSDIEEYTHTGTPYNPTTGDVSLTAASTFSFTPTQPRSIDISPDGTVMWVISNTTGRDIYEVTMSTPFDLTTAAMGSEYEPSEGDMICMKFSPDGYKYYALSLAGTLYEYTVSAQWDISTSSYTGRSLDVTQTSRNVTCFEVSPDGTKLVVGMYGAPFTSNQNEFAYYTA